MGPAAQHPGLQQSAGVLVLALALVVIEEGVVSAICWLAS
jgi:hypothetical protein